MTSWNDDSAQDAAPVAIDVYGIKAAGKPGELGEPLPTTWSDVRDQIRGHLLRLAVAPTRLLAELFEGATRLVRGVSSLPGAVSARVHNAHAQADRGEERRQLQAERRKELPGGASRGQGDASVAEALVARLEMILERLRAQGRDGTVVLMQSGSILVILGTAEDARHAIEAAAEDVLLMMSSTDTATATTPTLEIGSSVAASPALSGGEFPDRQTTPEP